MGRAAARADAITSTSSSTAGPLAAARRPEDPLHLRIALISEHASPLATLGGVDCGGQNVYVAEVARRLAQAGHEVDVLTRRADDAPEVVTTPDGVRVVHVDAGPAAPVPKEELLPLMDEFADGVVRFARREGGYDVSHANFFMSGLASRALRRAMGTPFVITFHALGRVRRLHQGGADRFPPERGRIEEDLANAADRIIAECPEDADDLRRHYHADRGKMRLVPCGVDAERFHVVPRDHARRAIGLPVEEFLVLQLGRLVPRKGVDDAIRAIARLLDEHGIRARLLVVGGDGETPDPGATPEIGRLQRLARELGVDDQVTFVGRRDRDALRLYYSAADVFVSLPWYEPFGMTPLEAMACGTPVVGSAVGGIKYSVVDGQTGFLVPPHDPGAAAERLMRLHRDPDLRQAFSRTGLRRARLRFSWDRIVDALVRVYAEVAPRVAGRAPALAARGG
jgi:D-inositol-3-phosphate glycosyltransferase